ncbi:MAG: bifunctional metallophosphatase/5'-nucleotidase [Bdellovibrionia bacterium]
MTLSPRGLFLILVLTLSPACSTLFQKSPEETSSRWQGSFSTEEGLETVVIVGTNDLHGTLAPIQSKSREKPGIPSVSYEFGGASQLAAYLKTLQDEFQEHLIWLDGGDQFQGSIESNTELGQPMVRFFELAGLSASAVGNHEFDFGLPTLKQRLSEAHYPYLAANVRDRETQKLAPFPNTFTRKMLKAGSLQVGVIGLSTEFTPVTTRPINVQSLAFENLKEATLREAQLLREQGAHLVLVAAHAGVECETQPTSFEQTLRKPLDPQGGCNDQDEMYQLLHALPAGTIDAVVSGHTHTLVHHWIAGVPVIQGGAFGKYLNLIYLTYDWKKKKLRPDQTRIEGPIPVCSKVFAHQQNCDGSKPAPPEGRGPLIDPVFHGRSLKKDPQVEAFLSQVLAKSESVKNKVIGTAVRPLEHRRLKESELGNLIADSIRAAVHSDVAYMNPGGVRAPIEAGKITYGDLFRSLPFENQIVTIRVTGRELKQIIQVAQSGYRGFGSVSGLKMRLIDPAYPAPFVDLDGSGRHDLWKLNRLLDLRLSDGTRIEDSKTYSLALSDFLASGGDDMGWPMSQISKDRVHYEKGVMARDALLHWIELSGPLNSEDHPLVNPAEPRLQFEVPGHPPRKSKKHRKSRHKRNS